VPDWQSSQVGPFDLWPTGLGFEYFYGFIGGDTNQWRPAVTEGTKPIDPYLGNPDYNFDYDYGGGGIGKGGAGTLSVDGQQVAQGRIDRTIPIRVSLDEGLDVGEDTGTPVTLTYDVPFKFTGKLAKVTIDLK
jgi:hypothetical protein